MKKIMVPTDFSECANNAIDVAFELARKDQAEIHFVHLMDIPVDWINLVEADQKKMYPDITAKVREINNKLDELIDKASKVNLLSKKFILYNCSYKYLIEHIENFDCDFVVMGSHGSSGLAEWFIGSNTQKVVRTSPVPVMVVKEGCAPFRPHAIVFCSDFETDTIDGFKKIVDFAKMLGAKIHLLFVNTPGNFTETPVVDLRMNRYMSVINGDDVIAGTWIYNSYDFEKGLLAFTDQHGDLIAMVTHGTKGSLTERIINHVDMPVLSVHY